MKRLCTFLTLVAGLALVAGLSGSTSLIGNPSAATTGWAYLKLRVGGVGGTVTANPSGTIMDPSCPNGICVLAYPEGTAVDLVPAWTPGSSFQGWKKLNGLPGTCYYVGNTCRTTVSGSEGLMAAFSPVQLTVGSTSGGWVEILTAGRSCGSGCAFYPYGGTADIQAHAQNGYSFDGWSGGCQGIGPGCTVRLWDNRSLSAVFGCHLDACSSQQPITAYVSVTVTTHGSGQAVFLGHVCRGRCTLTAPQLSMVSVESRPDPGAAASGWSGSVRCAVGGTRCNFPAFADARGIGPRVDVYFR
jgi:hypothetical protein